ncbi:MAG TPA: endonuclease/exonuclease/phosphatase family protein [Actinomycetes bacterium]|nr:endonuclease/exonuclease/phosphatase family protein [Actinomycetes bacterium]
MAELRLLQLNIEYGGTGVDFDKVVEAIEVSGATVAALQEGCGSMPRIADALDWPYVDNRTQVVSQVPLLDPPAASDGVVFVELEPGRVLAIVNVHPPSRGYGPFRVADEPVKRVDRRERRVRLSHVQPSLDAARALMDDRVPVILLGDFNAPSHRDWTDATVGSRPHVVRAFKWPTSVAAEETGLVDAYRAVYPDPVTHPGLTWPAERPFVKGYNPAADGHAEDRIDFMYVSPDINVEDMRIMGESESPYSDLSITPWPTDHRGLLAELRLEPAPAPALVSVSRRIVPLGDDVEVRVLGASAASVVVVPHDAEAETVVFEVPAPDAGRWHLATEFVGAGQFDVVARDEDRKEVARTRLWVAGPGDQPSVHTDRARYASGEPIGVRWSWTPGNRADWIAIYPRGVDVGGQRPTMHLATAATIEGAASFSEASHRRRWPLEPGEYTAHLLMDDLRVSLASSDFSVG